MPEPKVIPIYTTKGDAEIFLVYPYLYNRLGEWVGWVARNKDVYSVLGYYVGALSRDPRILRKRSVDPQPRQIPPPKPQRVYPPATVPLAPLMRELSYDTVDVLMEEPERLHPLDSGELREDMD